MKPLSVYLSNNNNNNYNNHDLVARNSQRICTCILISTYTCIDTMLFFLVSLCFAKWQYSKGAHDAFLFICLFCCYESDVKMEKKPRSTASAVEELHSLHVIKEIIVGFCKKQEKHKRTHTPCICFSWVSMTPSSLRWKCKLKCNSFLFFKKRSPVFWWLANASNERQAEWVTALRGAFSKLWRKVHAFWFHPHGNK